ncbi:MAG: NAD(P)H-binding protein, partial [Lachnospiraceae bacterium]|nr:NAD(P)H-binding protein [Lachnospiraceae bacterium]
MRIVVTGATSFVGAATVNELLNRGHEVIAVVRPGSKKLDRIPSQESLSIVENDLSDSHL